MKAIVGLAAALILSALSVQDAAAQVTKGAIYGTHSKEGTVPPGEIWEVSSGDNSGSGRRIYVNGFPLAAGQTVTATTGNVIRSDGASLFVTYYAAQPMVDAQELAAAKREITSANEKVDKLEKELERVKKVQEETRLEWIQKYGSNMQSVINYSVTNVVDSSVRRMYESKIDTLERRVRELEIKLGGGSRTNQLTLCRNENNSKSSVGWSDLRALLGGV